MSPTATAVDVLNTFKSEQALHDLFQFISNSGLFNLDQLRGDLFMQWSEQLNIDKFIQPGNGRLVPNAELGRLLDDLYKQMAPGQGILANLKVKDQTQTEEIKEADEGEEEGQIGRIPSELPLKLAVLGRAFSGKKTIARQLQEKYGGDKNIKLFNMDEIIKEALDYITPKKVDEAALEAAKKAKKGKQEEASSVDHFEGKHIDEYKKIATTIRQKYFPDYEGDTLH